ncbi:tetratricopeptide repeat protein [candidate division WOR-3 bacterium]|nr:tetratricopeptide repeat protein [candidate division WOR-3 bacterium]
MQVCSTCGLAAKDGQKFCTRCGGQVVAGGKPCPKCGAALKDDQKFCPKCGAGVAELRKAGQPKELTARVEILEKRIADEPHNTAHYLKLGDAYAEFRMFEPALVQYQKAATIDESLVEAHLKSGQAYLTSGKPDRARASFEKVLLLKPELAEAGRGLFLTLCALGQTGEAVKLGREAVAAAPDALDLRRSFAELLLESNRLPEAVQQFEEIARRTPEEAEAHRLLAGVLSRAGDAGRAAASFRKAVDLGSKAPDALLSVGKSQLDDGRLAEAAKLLAPAVAAAPGNALARLWLAQAQLGLSDLEAASRTLDGLAPDSWTNLEPAERARLASLCADLGSRFLERDPARAESLLGRSLQVEHTPPAAAALARIHVQRADAARADGDPTRAAREYARAIQLSPEHAEAKAGLARIRQRTSRRRTATRTVLIIAAAAAVLLAAAGAALWYFSYGRLACAYSTDQAMLLELDGERWDGSATRLPHGNHAITAYGRLGYPDTTVVAQVNGGSSLSLTLELTPRPVQTMSARLRPFTAGEGRHLENHGTVTAHARMAQQHGHAFTARPFRCCDGQSWWMYRLGFDFAPRGGNLRILNARNQYRISMSIDGENWAEVAAETRRIRNGSNRLNLNATLDGCFDGKSRALFVKFEDAFPDDGWGACIDGIDLTVRR